MDNFVSPLPNNNNSDEFLTNQPENIRNNKLDAILKQIRESEDWAKIYNAIEKMDSITFKDEIKILFELAKKQYYGSIDIFLIKNEHNVVFDQLWTDENGNTFLHILYETVDINRLTPLLWFSQPIKSA